MGSIYDLGGKPLRASYQSDRSVVSAGQAKLCSQVLGAEKFVILEGKDSASKIFQGISPCTSHFNMARQWTKGLSSLPEWGVYITLPKRIQRLRDGIC